MKIDLKILQVLQPSYGVVPLSQVKGVKEIISAGSAVRAPASYEPLLLGAGYDWDETKHCYIMLDQNMYYIQAHNIFLWVWKHSLLRALQSTVQLQKWVQGDEKYPEGKGNKFVEVYSQMTSNGSGDSPDTGSDVNIGGNTSRNMSYNDKPLDETDALIAHTKKKMGKSGTLPHDDILDLYAKSNQGKNEKLMKFIKTITPLKENSIKTSTLSEIIRHIVKEIVKEGIKDLDEMSVAAAAGPVTGPVAFKKKPTMEEDDKSISEMTMTGNVSGYNIPGAFSKKGGSEAGVKGAEAIGYTLTPTGEKDMNRSADKL